MKSNAASIGKPKTSVLRFSDAEVPPGRNATAALPATDSRYYAVDANTFELVASEIIPDPERPLAQRLERILLPVRLRFTSWRTQLIRPNINDD